MYVLSNFPVYNICNFITFGRDENFNFNVTLIEMYNKIK